MMRYLGWALAAAMALSTWAAEAAAETTGLRDASVVAGRFSLDGDLLEAGEDGLTLDLPHGSRVVLSAGSRFRFLRSLKLPVGSPERPMIPASVMRLEHGRVDADVRAPKYYALLVLGPRKARMIAKGGSVTVLARSDGMASVTHSGLGLVSLGTKWLRLPPGNTHVVDGRRPSGLRREVLPAPGVPRLSQHLLLAGGSNSKGTTRVSWPTVRGADAYEVRVATPDGAVVQEHQVGSPPFSLSGLEAGNYQVSVRAVDDAGVSSVGSAPIELHVVGMSIPRTAILGPEGQVRLQPGQRVGLLGVGGLEVGYLGFDSFLPAPSSIGLVARRPISLLLRHPDTHESVGLRLEPMTVHAQIAFDRHPETWPDDGVPVTVKLVDAEGYDVPESFVANCRVTVNLVEVQPKWERDGGTLRARLSRPEGTSRPWVVRVDVLDERGASLGMDFSEVGYQRPERSRSATR